MKKRKTGFLLWLQLMECKAFAAVMLQYLWQYCFQIPFRLYAIMENNDAAAAGVV